MTDAFEACEGGCTCGQTRYQVHAIQPLIVHACHCSWCQRQSGAPHVINAIYEAKHIELTHGKVETVVTPSPSGTGQAIGRCPSCKIALWSNYLVNGMGDSVRFLRVGTLDDPTLMPPDIHIFTSSKMAWYVLPPEHLAVEEYYDVQTVWRSDSLKRYADWQKESGKTAVIRKSDGTVPSETG